MKRLLKSKKIHGSKRTYYFNLYELTNGEKVLEVTESRMLAANKFDRKVISVFLVDLEDFLLTFEGLLDLD